MHYRYIVIMEVCYSMKKFILCIALLSCLGALANQCEYGAAVCERDHTTIKWSCPDGQTPVARAFWGRDPGDDHTCVKRKRSKSSSNPDCPGDDNKASDAVAEWCNRHVNKNGTCHILASSSQLRVAGQRYDPCPGTAKYLRVCSYCKEKPSYACEYGEPVCFGQNTTIKWRCAAESDERPVARAFYGREAGDTRSCMQMPNSSHLNNLPCPGDDNMIVNAVGMFCNEEVDIYGDCKIILEGNAHVPCPGTASYLRVCSYCRGGYSDNRQ